MKRTILGAALLLALVSPALAAHHARKAPAAHGPVAIGKSKLSPGVAVRARPHISFKAGGAANCNPNFVTGQVPSAALWNAAIGCAYPTAGGQLGGAVTTPASTTAQAPLNIPPGTGPTAPNNGDIWADGTGIFYQSGGATVGPLGTGGGSGPDVNVIQWAGQPVGAPTSLGVAPSSGLFPTINTQILNSTIAISNTSFGISGSLPAFASTPTFNIGALGGAATAVNQATIAGNQMSGGQKTQVVDSFGNSLGTSGHPFLIACADGSTTCTGSGGGGGGGGSSGSSVQGTKSAPIEISTATTTRLITGQSGQFAYVTGWDVVANGSGALKLVYGTTSSTPCDTGQNDLTGNYSWTAQTGINKVATGVSLVAPVNTDVCAVTSAATSLQGSIQYTQSATPLSSFGGGGSGGGSAPFLTAGTYLDVASVSSSAANSAYPAGAGGVVVYNYGAVVMAVKLSSSGTATGTFATSDAIIQAGGCAQLQTTGFTNLNYYTQSSTTSMHAVGVASGVQISCGGGGGSSSGNASVGAIGSVAPGSATLGGYVDPNGNTIAPSAASPFPVSGNVIQADSSIRINIASATTTQLVALTSGKSIYITNFNVIAGGTGNITLEYGTGSSCATGTTTLTGAYPLIAQAGISNGVGLGPVLIVPASNALCAVTSAGVQMSGSLSYKVQ